MSHLLSPGLLETLKESDLLFDTVAVDQLIFFNAGGVMKEMKKVKAVFCYIHEVFLELMATDKSPKRAERQLFLSEYEFKPITHVYKNTRSIARKLQEKLHKIDSHPSPTDLYLGACLSMFTTGNTNTYLITGDVKDFPSPIFEKVGFIVLSSDKHVRALTVLSMNERIYPDSQ